MPVLQRKQLRRDLGIRRLREATVGTTSMSLGAGATVNVLDRTLAAPDFSGQGLFQRAWLRVASADYRVGSFNTQSGSFVSGQTAIYAIASGADFEVHEKLAPMEMDNAIDEVILQLQVRREVGIPTIDGASFYTLDGAASPNTIKSVLNVYYFANPSGSLNRDRRDFPQFAVVNTATGVELRPPFALGASMQLVLDAMLILTMGAGGDAATISLPDEETVLWGAAARCYDLLIADTPGQQSNAYRERRAEAAHMFSRRAGINAPAQDKKLTFERAMGSGPWGDDPLLG